ncbi:MAG: hypothetical protein ABIR68_13435 [Ilumatobacteraceae bacterium]
MKKKQRIITGVGLAAGLVAGGGAGLILESSGSAGASTPPTTSPTDPTASTGSGPATPATPTPAAPATGKADRNDRLKQVLQSLVDDGTLTQAQLDAVIAKLDAAGPLRGGGVGGVPGMRGGGRGVIGIGLDTVATTLGVSVGELRTALEGGTTIAEYATSKGKTAQDVIDALVAKTKSELDIRVAAGDTTQADADTRLAEVTKVITDVVNNGGPVGGPGFGMGGGRADHPAGKHGQHKDLPGGATPRQAPATTTPGTDTTAPGTTSPGTTPATTGS